MYFLEILFQKFYFGNHVLKNVFLKIEKKNSKILFWKISEKCVLEISKKII